MFAITEPISRKGFLALSATAIASSLANSIVSPTIAQAATSYSLKNLSGANTTVGAPATGISLIGISKQTATVEYNLSASAGMFDITEGGSASQHVYLNSNTRRPTASNPNIIKNFLTLTFNNAGYTTLDGRPIDAVYDFDLNWCYNNVSSSDANQYGYPCSVLVTYKHPNNMRYPNSLFWVGAYGDDPARPSNSRYNSSNVDIITTVTQGFYYAGTGELVDASYAMIIRDIDGGPFSSRSKYEEIKLISGFKRDVYISPETWFDKSLAQNGTFHSTRAINDGNTMRTSFIAYTEPKSLSKFSIAETGGWSIGYAVESPETYPQWNPPTKKLTQ